MIHLLLLDVAPNPISTGISTTGLILVAVVVFMITAAVLLAAVFLFKRLKTTSNRSGTRLVVGDVCLNLDGATTQPNTQTDSTHWPRAPHLR